MKSLDEALTDALELVRKLGDDNATLRSKLKVAVGALKYVAERESEAEIALAEIAKLGGK